MTTPSRVWVNQFVWDQDRDTSIADVEDRGDFAGTTRTLTGGKFVDSFRYFYPDKKDAFTNWCTLTGARETNYGRRLDYIFTSIELAKSDLKDCVIMADVEGSDHCPVKAEYFSEFIPAEKCPPLCTKFMPEFCGKQVKLSSFFIKKEKTIENSDTTDSQKLAENISQSVTNKADTVSLKRPCSVEKNGNPAKKKKADSADSKQGSIKGFFLKSCSKTEVVEIKIKEPSSDSKEENSVTDTEVKAVNLVTVKSNSASAWKNLLQGPPPPPLCKGHQEPCVLRTVKKPGPTKGKQFFVCARGEGHSSNPEARCDFFKWVDYKKK